MHTTTRLGDGWEAIANRFPVRPDYDEVTGYQMWQTLFSVTPAGMLRLIELGGPDDPIAVRIAIDENRKKLIKAVTEYQSLRHEGPSRLDVRAWLGSRQSLLEAYQRQMAKQLELCRYLMTADQNYRNV